MNSNYSYKVGGSLDFNHPTYVVRQADREFCEALKQGDFCYVLNSRQTGKSSLRVQTMYKLQAEGIACAEIDLTGIGSDKVTPEQWYGGIIQDLTSSFDLSVDRRRWWRDRDDLSAVHRFSLFIEQVLLAEVKEPIAILIDEIDTMLRFSFKDDFFALIRACYNRRADKPEYNRLTFALLGVATPSDLIQDKTRTPFNIGRAIELTGFQLDEVTPLAPGLEAIARQSTAVLREVLNWTGGQPFLTQKLCKLIVTNLAEIEEGREAEEVEKLVRSHLIENWASQDEPEHLKTISDRLLRSGGERTGRLLGLYQQILPSPPAPLPTLGEGSKNSLSILGEGSKNSLPIGEEESKTLVPLLPRWEKGLGDEGIPSDNSPEQIELRLSGLVVKQRVRLRVYNRIYAEVFDRLWVAKALADLRPYAEAIAAWETSNCQDESRLLRGQSLQDALSWASGKSLSDRDYQFLAGSQEVEKREMQVALETEKRTRELEKLEAQINLEAERKEKEAQQQANQILTKAAKKANQRIRIGSIILGISLVGATLAGVFAGIASHQLKEAREGTRLEQAATNILQQFHSTQLEALLPAMRASRDLKKLIKDKRSLAEYPAVSPLFTLQNILFNIREYNSLEGHQGSVKSIAFSPDGQTIASGSDDKTIKLWKRDGTLISTFSGDSYWVTSVAFSPDGQTIASGGGDKTIKLWKRDGTLISTLSGHTEAVYSVAFSPDGQTIASGGRDKTIKLWKRDGTLITTLFRDTYGVRSIAFSPDGQTIASGSRDGIKLWKRDRTLITTLSRDGGVTSVAFSPDGQTIASGGYDKTIKLWKQDGTLISTLSGHTDGVSSLGFSPDGQTIASGSVDKTIKLWKQDGTLITTLSGHSNLVTSVAFSPDGQTIASGGYDKTIKLWKRDGTLITTLSGHTDGVSSLAFSPDGQTIASGGWDNTINLWKLDGTLITTLTGLSDSVSSVAFSPDGQTLTSVGGYGTVILWNLNLDDLRARGCLWLKDYLATHPQEQEIREICREVGSWK
ncbi:MAG: AAA-like domain-containing protein [Cyanosarcina radialis HA8281-LM2]|jgi:WD40 repeat protein|nr:AAA-like domain-containing protein [Cyanosarcina radialis HA8281-LM2]